MCKFALSHTELGKHLLAYLYIIPHKTFTRRFVVVFPLGCTLLSVYLNFLVAFGAIAHIRTHKHIYFEAHSSSLLKQRPISNTNNDSFFLFSFSPTKTAMRVRYYMCHLLKSTAFTHNNYRHKKNFTFFTLAST